MMKLKTLIIMIAATTAALTACTEERSAQQQQMMPITLTTNIAPTRGVQDTQIASGQTLYVWAKTEDGGTADWTSGDCYIEAWQLTAGSEGALTSANGTTYYYPPQSLSMIALHGNFSFTEGQTPFPAIVSHSVLSDQSTAGNLEQSDLLWCRQNGCTAANNPQSVTLGHKLSKIEITLSSSIYTNAEIDQMTVTLNNVLPTVDLTLSTGNTGAAHGNTIAVTPRRTATATENSGKAVFEAVIPAQTRPSEFITVRLNGGVVSVDAQVTEFEANKRYPYTLDMTYRDVRKNPLWYVAEYNVNYDGAGNYSWATTPDEGYYFSWYDAMKAFTTASNASVSAGSETSINDYYISDGSKISGWHLPVKSELLSILPADSNNGDINIFDFDTGTGTYKETNITAVFGYNSETMTTGISDASYWIKINNYEIRAIRFLGTDYCSAWKYELKNNSLIISATLIGKIENSESAASSFYTTYWTSIEWGNHEEIGAVQRIFYAYSHSDSGSSATVTGSGAGVDDSSYSFLGYYGRYQCATQSNASAGWRLNFNLTPNVMATSVYTSYGKSYGFPVRLFRNNPHARATNISNATVDNLYVGDILCSDGSIYPSATASTQIAAASKTPIGIIVFVNKTGNAMGNAATERSVTRNQKAGTTINVGHALVMCLKKSPNATWNSAEPSSAYSSLYIMEDAEFYNNAAYYPGYARTYDMHSQGHYPAATSAYNYTTLPAPSSTTGWFLPSVGQWRLIFAGLTSHKNFSRTFSTDYNEAWTGAYLAGQLNAAMAHAGAGKYDEFTYQTGGTTPSTVSNYWTSSEMSNSGAACVDFYIKGCQVDYWNNWRTESQIRPVLAF